MLLNALDTAIRHFVIQECQMGFKLAHIPGSINQETLRTDSQFEFLSQ
jgi:hypothetical protein